MTQVTRLVRKEDVLVVLLDYQTGMFSLVRDLAPAEFKNNVLALAACARHFGVPTILTSIMDYGPNGPLLPEIRAMFPDAPYVRRSGEINAWDNAEFVQAVRATGRRQIVLAGIVTDAGVAMLALTAAELGFAVFVVSDACGTFSPAARDAAHRRLAGAGVQLISWFALACELHRDWRNDIEGLAALFARHIPHYANLISSQAILPHKAERPPRGIAAAPGDR
ncbi:MAG TPA: isochorismatase family protein [Beijerinckiaceae bacterium]|nr:isochorismatase family protein [Beijerinckiaceae bacterium]